jgi:hypothetical protein
VEAKPHFQWASTPEPNPATGPRRVTQSTTPSPPSLSLTIQSFVANFIAATSRDTPPYTPDQPTGLPTKLVRVEGTTRHQ